MAYNFKETMNKPERLAPGHRMCAGCGGTIAVRNVLRGLHEGDKAVIGNATGCLEVSTFTYPYTAWEDSYIHNAFENAGATLSGVEGAYNALKRKGKLDETYKFITFGGDGGTYDIGFQSLSGAMERNHDMVYVCYDNGAYMNTGIQRSSATPMYADTTTTPAGKVSNGKVQVRKDLGAVCKSAGIPKRGFLIRDLIGGISDYLGYESSKVAVLLGAGNLGMALMSYRGFENYGIKIVAAFDSNNDITDGKQVFKLEELGEICREYNVKIGIITVPESSAQKACDMLVENGIKAIWNFAPTYLKAPEDILVQNENMASSLALLSNHLRLKMAEE